MRIYAYKEKEIYRDVLYFVCVYENAKRDTGKKEIK